MKGRKLRIFDQSDLRLVSVRYPLCEQFNPDLRPGTFASWRRRWHHGAPDTSNPVVDSGRMCLHVVITRQIEGLTHGMNVSVCEERPNVSVCEERPNVSLKARQFCHFPHLNGMDLLLSLVFRINSKVELLPLWHIEQ